MPAAPSKVETVVLHIGRHKTGTSSIQATLKANRERLAERGVYYPACLPANHSGFFVNAFAPNPAKHHNNTRDNRTRAEIDRIVEGYMAELRRELDGFEGHTAIFSAEDASTVLVPRGINRIRNTFDRLCNPGRFKVVLYTRHPISFAHSAIQQNVKGNGMYLDEARRRHVVPTARRYREIVEAYRKVFGPEALVLRSFEAAVKTEGGLFADFMAAAGLDPEGIAEERSNEGICSEMVHFLSWLYEGPPQQEGEPFVLNRASRVALTPEDRAALFALKGAKASFFDHDEQMLLWSCVADDMTFLSQEFGIEYQPPGRADAAPMFQERFMQDLRAVWPRLSEPVRHELTAFLNQNVAGDMLQSLD